MTRSSGARAREEGFSVVELVVSTALLGLVIGFIGMIAARGQGAHDASQQSLRLAARTSRALDRVVAELAFLGGDLVNPDPTAVNGVQVLNFRQATGVAGGVVTWGSAARLGFEYAAGEIDNGLDDDGNGLADEGLLVLTFDVGGAGERRVVLCNGVAEGGFNLQRTGEVMNVRLTAQEAGPGGRILVRTLQTAFRLRN